MKLNKEKIIVKGRVLFITSTTGILYVYDIPNSPSLRLRINVLYWVAKEPSRLNDFFTSAVSLGLKSGDIYFREGSPGEILNRKKRNVISKNKTKREVQTLFANTLKISFLIKILFNS
jgi:hypothetical protein